MCCLETSGAHAQVVESTIGSVVTAKSRSKFKELISSFLASLFALRSYW